MSFKVQLYEKQLLVFEHKFKDGESIILGRAKECDVQLDPHPNISRKHIEIFFSDGVITFKKLTDQGQVFSEGIEVQDLTVTSNREISFQPYNLKFIKSVEEKKNNLLSKLPSISKGNGKSTNKLPVSSGVHDGEKTHNIASSDKPELIKPKVNTQVSEVTHITEDGADFEKTMVSPLSYRGFLIVINGDGTTQEVEINTNPYVVGKSPETNLMVQHNSIANEQFKVDQILNQFYITDLGSSSPTFLNQEALTPHEQVVIRSGDEFKVRDLVFIFELKDKEYTKKIDNLPALLNTTEFQLEKDEYNGNTGVELIQESVSDEEASRLFGSSQYSSSSRGRGVQVEKGVSSKNNKRSKKSLVRLSLVLLILGLGLFAFLDQDKNKALKELAKSRLEKNRLEQEKNKAIEDTLDLATRYFNQAKYGSCIGEIEKIKSQFPDYTGADNVLNQCKEGLDYLARQTEKERLERERQEQRSIIAEIIKECETQVKLGFNATKNCLNDAMERDPTNEIIQNMLDQAQKIDDIEAQKKERQKAYAQRVAAGNKVYNKAEKYKKSEEWYKAIANYRKYIKGKYPDPKKNKVKGAKNSIAWINKTIKSRRDKSLSDAKSFYEEQDYKSAAVAAQKGLLTDSRHIELLNIYNDSVKNLTLEMQTIYQDSIIEEDIGNVEIAKNKWRQIIDFDVPQGKYFLKALRKLSNYGEIL